MRITLQLGWGGCFALIGFLIMHSVSIASVITFTDQQAFFVALDGSGMTRTTENFEAETVGSSIPNGTGIDKIKFNYDIFGELMGVTDIYSTTSGLQSLGLINYDNSFYDGDGFEIQLDEPISALGMYFITSDPVIDNEIQLSTNAGDAYIASGTEEILADGSFAYFLGLKSDTTFSTASIGFLDNGIHFAYNVDDITTARSEVPEPSSLLLMLTGVLGLVARTRRK